MPTAEVERYRDGIKRHPTLEDNVIAYAGATILGGDTVVGRGSVIEGNAWVVNSIPPGSRVTAQVEVHVQSAPSPLRSNGRLAANSSEDWVDARRKQR
jgi:serine O-acetyltransferase